MSDPTADLIDRLASDLAPTPRHGLLQRIALGIGAGAVLSLVIVLALWGLRPDFAHAMATPAFWMKTAFTLLLAIAGFTAVAKLARPGGSARSASLVICIAVLGMGVAAIIQLASAPSAAWKSLVMGGTSAVCPWLILALSLPIFAGAFWAMRAMAPTRLHLAGAAVGLASGAISASAYAMSCAESTMPFIFVWYGGAIATATFIGWLVGPRLLRW